MSKSKKKSEVHLCLQFADRSVALCDEQQKYRSDVDVVLGGGDLNRERLVAAEKNDAICSRCTHVAMLYRLAYESGVKASVETLAHIIGHAAEGSKPKGVFEFGEQNAPTSGTAH